MVLNQKSPFQTPLFAEGKPLKPNLNSNISVPTQPPLMPMIATIIGTVEELKRAVGIGKVLLFGIILKQTTIPINPIRFLAIFHMLKKDMRLLFC
jgi:hypothetical protein